MMKLTKQELEEVVNAPFVQSVKYLVVRGTKYSKQELVDRMKHEQIYR